VRLVPLSCPTTNSLQWIILKALGEVCVRVRTTWTLESQIPFLWPFVLMSKAMRNPVLTVPILPKSSCEF
jgi:hypothetical protein